MKEDTSLNRRGFLWAAGGAMAAAVGTAGAQEGTETEAETGNGTATGTGTPAGNQSGGGGNQSDGGGNQTDGNQTGGGGDGGGATPVSKSVVVGPGGDFVFNPETVQVTPGSTVTWNWESDTHNIVVNSQPDGADWQGHESIENSGFSYENTFETTGTYEYYCQPHRQQGMSGTVEVVESISTPGGGGGGGPPPVPDTAKTLGVATTIGMLTTLGLAYAFLKYGGAETTE